MRPTAQTRQSLNFSCYKLSNKLIPGFIKSDFNISLTVYLKFIQKLSLLLTRPTKKTNHFCAGVWAEFITTILPIYSFTPLDFIKKNMNDLIPFSKKNYILFSLSFILIISGLVIMSMDKHMYGYGIAGLTLGPMVLMVGFILPFWGIFAGAGISKNTKTIYEKYISLSGWIVFTICLGIYCYTAERTTSFWDCGEFIAASFKLQIPHPPGAPLFLLIGKIFSIFSPGKEWVAYCINLVSVVASAVTVKLLYTSTAMLVKRLLKIDSVSNKTQAFLIALCSLTSSLSFAFTDSFWFNATEAEVYALSCLFTAFSFWGMLKWQEAKKPYAIRWLYFIAYLTGLSIGVHLLNLLTFPAIAFILYFKNFNFSFKGVILVCISGIAMIALVTEGIIVGLPTLAGITEVYFVNTFQLPFTFGIYFFSAGLVAILIVLLRYSFKHGKGILHTITMCLMLVLVGYMSYLIVLVRSSFNPPLDENDPGDIMSMILYLKRDQYGSRPLIKGPFYTAGYPISSTRKSPRFRKNDVSKKYEIYDYDYEYEYDHKHTTLFPRAYSSEPRHIEAYKKWMGIKNDKKPTMAENIYFFITYQLGHQYSRYFMWNFVGRESDVQNAGWIKPSQWFKQNVPDIWHKNKARNNYFCLPFILGLIGLFVHVRKKSNDAFVLLLFFIFSGVAISVYLNQPPIEPRERDYTYVGSFYAFSFWMGIGIIPLVNYIRRIFSNNIFVAAVNIILALTIPSILLAVNWNDHNRTGRYFARDIAKNVLSAPESQGIIFTSADNDTFPLWYMQEAEEFRTDVRICNLSLLNMEWYIESMKQRCNKSTPLPISLSKKDFSKGKNEHIYLVENPRLRNGINLDIYLKLIKSNDPFVITKQDKQQFTILPSKSIFLPVEKTKVEKHIPIELRNSIADKMVFDIAEGISKSSLIVLDIIASNEWKRPIYFTYTSIQDYPFLKPYLQKEGFVYRLLPIQSNSKEGWLNSDKMYTNLMVKAQWKGLNDPAVYQDPAGNPFISQSRMEFFELANYLFLKNEKLKAKEVLLQSLNIIPDVTIPYDYSMVHYPGLLYKIGEQSKAIEMCKIMGERSIEFLDYYSKNKEEDQKEYYLYILYTITSQCKDIEPELYKKFNQSLNVHLPQDSR